MRHGQWHEQSAFLVFIMSSIKLTLIVATTLAVTSFAWSASLTSEAGVSYAAISGLRSYSAPDLTHSSTSSLVIPFVRVSTDLAINWRLGASYSYIGSLKGSGVSPNTNIFRDPDVGSAQVLTPFNSTEKIHEFAVDLRYACQVADRCSFQFGPVASVLHSKATIAHRSFSATEVKLGAVAELRYDLTREWQLAIGCRYSQPTDRNIAQFSLSAAYRL